MTYGREFSQVCLAKEAFAKQGIELCVLKLNTIAPIPRGALEKAADFENVFFFEEGIRHGGAGERFGFELYQRGFNGKYSLTAIEDIVLQARTESALHKTGLDSAMIEEKLLIELGGGENGGKEKT